MNYEEALGFSYEMVSLLFRYCVRIQPTGALRRRETELESVEMIALPQIVERNSFWKDGDTGSGGEPAGADRLEAGINSLVEKGVLRRVQGFKPVSSYAAARASRCYGLKYKEATVVVYSVVRPSDWGVEFLLSTGDEDFLAFLYKRAVRMGFTFKGESLKEHRRSLDGFEEHDVLRVLCLEWIEPENRNRKFIERIGLS